jgi:hypothetical protein
MFVATKVKLAAGLATGALALGGAGAYAAANANNTVPVTNAKQVTVNGGTTPTFSLISVSGTMTTPIDATKFTNPGQCVSTFAKNKDLALTPAAGSTKISKNFHGKLMSTVQSWCQQFNKSKASTTDTQTTETPDATQPADSTDSSDQPSAKGLSHGHGQAHGRGHSNA